MGTGLRVFVTRVQSKEFKKDSYGGIVALAVVSLDLSHACNICSLLLLGTHAGGY